MTWVQSLRQIASRSCGTTAATTLFDVCRQTKDPVNASVSRIGQQTKSQQSLSFDADSFVFALLTVSFC
jgi:hypothetical protein